MFGGITFKMEIKRVHFNILEMDSDSISCQSLMIFAETMWQQCGLDMKTLPIGVGIGLIDAQGRTTKKFFFQNGWEIYPGCEKLVTDYRQVAGEKLGKIII